MPIVALFAALATVLGTTIIADVRDPRDRHQEERDQLVEAVDAVRAVELARGEKGGGYEACGDEKRARAAISAPPEAAEPCWADLGGGRANRVMWVVVAVDDFAVHAVEDADGDGTVAEIVATKGAPAAVWTPPTVF